MLESCYDYFDEIDLGITDLENLKGTLECTRQSMICHGLNSYCEELLSLNCSIKYLSIIIDNLKGNFNCLSEVLKNGK